MEFDSKTLRWFGTVAISIISYQIIVKLLPWLYLHVVGPRIFGAKVDVCQMGSWCVITGATDGIGKAYAKEIARKGLNIVLISRSIPKLESVAKEIVDEFGVKTKIIEVDFTHDREIYEKIKKDIADLDIGVLINNVGISYPHPEFFVDLSNSNPQFMRDIVAANIHSVTHMTALVLPQMINKRKGVIINLSSIASVIPNPLLTIYSATKAFVNKFSLDLQTEYRQFGIIVQSVQPGFVVTNMTKIRKASFMAPTAETYVTSAINTIGYTDCTNGYLPHAILHTIIRLISAMFCEQFASHIIFKNLKVLRQKALRDISKKQ